MLTIKRKKEEDLLFEIMEIIETLLIQNNKQNLLQSDIYNFIMSNIIKGKNINKFYNFLDDNLFIIQDLKENQEMLNDLSTQEKDSFEILNILLNNIGLLDVSQNNSYNGPIEDKGYILIKENDKIISIVNYDDIIKEIQEIPPFFPVKFHNFEITN